MMPCSRFQVQVWIERIRREQEASFCSPEGDFSRYREQRTPFCSPGRFREGIFRSRTPDDNADKIDRLVSSVTVLETANYMKESEGAEMN